MTNLIRVALNAVTENPDNVKHVGDAVFVGVTAASVLGWLPAASAILSIVYMGFRFYELKTIQGWLGRKTDG